MMLRRAFSKQTFKSMKLLKVLLLATFIFLVAIDSFTTHYLVENRPAGINGESNPMAMFIISELGWSSMIVMKSIVFLALVAFAGYFGMNIKLRAFVNYGLLALLMIVVTSQANNLYMIGTMI